MTCEDCGHETCEFREWSKLTPEGRKGKRQRVGKKCRRCYDRARRGRGDERTTWRLADLVEEAEFLFGGGTDVRSVAFRLGLKPESLVRQYKRAFTRGLTTRELDYRRTSD